MNNIEETFEQLFEDHVFLPYNQRILLCKIQRYLRNTIANDDAITDFIFDVFLYVNYAELVKWCQKTNRTIQYLD